MHPLPNALRLAFPEADKQALEAWWAALSEIQRNEINTLCHTKLEKCFFGSISDDGQHIIPKLKDGQIIVRKKFHIAIDEWTPGAFEQLLFTPELVLVWDPSENNFHLGLNSRTAAKAAQPPR